MEPFRQPADASTISSLGEKALLCRIREWLGDSAPPSPFGMGDDCALIAPHPPLTQLVTTDSVVLGRHFSADTPAEAVGAKLLLRNLSDIAAMGGVPRLAVVAGFLPRCLSTAWLEGFVRGLATTARQYQTAIAGGDLAESSADLALNLTLIGYIPPEQAGRALLRTGGRQGDLIAVTGPLGGSFPQRHLQITPRLHEGRLLARNSAVSAAMDISDGLAIDLPALLPPDTSACIDLARLPIHPDALLASQRSGRDPLWHALHDGEDHELLFLLRDPDGSAWPRLLAGFAAAGLAEPICIGHVGPAAANALVDLATGSPICSTDGFDHFRT